MKSVREYRAFAEQIITEISPKIDEIAIIDVFQNKIKIYYTWAWYKKKLDKSGEKGNPFVIRRMDIYEKRGRFSEARQGALVRKLLNYFIYQNENGYSIKIS